MRAGATTVPRPPVIGWGPTGWRPDQGRRHVLSNVLTDRGNLHLDGSLMPEPSPDMPPTR